MMFDHAVVNVLGDMETAAARFTRFGFALTPRGYHTLGSINHLAVFRTSYLELLGYAPGEREKRAELWAHPPGLTGLALRSEDAAGLHDAMADKVPVEPCKDFSRPVEIRGTAHQAAFRTFQFDRSRIDNGRIFFCQHRTPELIWREEYRSHPNGATGIAGFALGSADPDALFALVAATPGIASPAPRELRAGETRVRFLSFAEVAAEFGPLPDADGRMRMAALAIACPSLDRVAEILTGNAVGFARDAGRIRLAPEETGGLYLDFVER